MNSLEIVAVELDSVELLSLAVGITSELPLKMENESGSDVSGSEVLKENESELGENEDSALENSDEIEER